MVWAYSLGLVGIFVTCLAMTSLSSEQAKAVATCKQVKLDATEDEVRKLMGAPIKTLPFNDGKKKSKILIFRSSPLASTAPQIEIDIATHRVIEVICDDEYRLAHPK